jgi:antitoxin component YwqK of YwqJK toxin-antitoxin module
MVSELASQTPPHYVRPYVQIWLAEDRHTIHRDGDLPAIIHFVPVSDEIHVKSWVKNGRIKKVQVYDHSPYAISTYFIDTSIGMSTASTTLIASFFEACKLDAHIHPNLIEEKGGFITEYYRTGNIIWNRPMVVIDKPTALRYKDTTAGRIYTAVEFYYRTGDLPTTIDLDTGVRLWCNTDGAAHREIGPARVIYQNGEITRQDYAKNGLTISDAVEVLFLETQYVNHLERTQ